LIKIFKLIINERIKVYKQKSSWIMICVLIIFVTLIGLLDRFLPQLKNSVFKNNWDYVMFNKHLIVIIALFMLIIGSSIVSKEYSQGTIKLLLIRPIKRWKILLAKYLTMMIVSFEMIIILFFVSQIVGSILFGFKGLNCKMPVVLNGSIVNKNAFGNVIENYMLSSAGIIIWLTFSFMVSTIFKNNSVAIGVSLFFMLAGSTIAAFMAMFKIEWVKYLLFANTDLSRYLDNRPLIVGMNMQFSVIVLISYFIVFNFITWVVFTRKDVS
jgi:ABC-2 type transport system permease protein